MGYPHRYEQALQGVSARGRAGDGVVVVEDEGSTWLCTEGAWEAMEASLRAAPPLFDGDDDQPGETLAYAELCRAITGPKIGLGGVGERGTPEENGPPLKMRSPTCASRPSRGSPGHQPSWTSWTPSPLRWRRSRGSGGCSASMTRPSGRRSPAACRRGSAGRNDEGPSDPRQGVRHSVEPDGDVVPGKGAAVGFIIGLERRAGGRSLRDAHGRARLGAPGRGHPSPGQRLDRHGVRATGR